AAPAFIASSTSLTPAATSWTSTRGALPGSWPRYGNDPADPAQGEREPSGYRCSRVAGHPHSAAEAGSALREPEAPECRISSHRPLGDGRWPGHHLVDGHETQVLSRTTPH